MVEAHGEFTHVLGRDDAGYGGLRPQDAGPVIHVQGGSGVAYEGDNSGGQ
ncbi:hypothetical protein [Streptomyces sp. NPDC002215]